MKDALRTASWRIRPDLKSEPSSEAGASWMAADEEEREG